MLEYNNLIFLIRPNYRCETYRCRSLAKILYQGHFIHIYLACIRAYHSVLAFFFSFFGKPFGEKGETTPQSNTEDASTASFRQPEEGPSDGERMTAELRGLISQFMQKVSLKLCHNSTKLLTIYEPSLI